MRSILSGIVQVIIAMCLATGCWTRPEPQSQEDVLFTVDVALPEPQDIIWTFPCWPFAPDADCPDDPKAERLYLPDGPTLICIETSHRCLPASWVYDLIEANGQ